MTLQRLLPILFAAAACGAFAISPVWASPAPTTVMTERGKVQGHVIDGVLSFKGFPYASPPVGNFRWRAPRPAKQWKGIYDASAFGHDCMQALSDVALAPVLTEPSEDCLYMNVWRPAEASVSKLPVMVYIYGGGFSRGGSSSTVYGGQSFAKKGVIFVSFNYRVGRLGFFGFPALTHEHPEEPKGNYGFMDQIAALKWVQQNIGAFGGDPTNVTLFGESAGGGSVHAMLTSPMTAKLFERAIIQSGGGRDNMLGVRYLEEDRDDFPSLETIGKDFAQKSGISGTDERALKQLRALPSKQAADLTVGLGYPGRVNWGGPSIDGKIVVGNEQAVYLSGKFNRVPVMVGSNSADLGDVPAKSMNDVLAAFKGRQTDAVAAYDPSHTGDVAEVARKVGSDEMMAEPARYVARTIGSFGIPTYYFRFSYHTEVLTDRWKNGAPHAAELPYVFNTVAPYYGPAVSARDKEVAEIANSYWTNFAKFGDPNGAGLPTWSKYDAQTDTMLEFHDDGAIGSEADPWRARLDLVAESANPNPLGQ